MKLNVREIDRQTDAAALQRLDTSFTSEFVYRVTGGCDELHLDCVSIPSPYRKSFTIDLEDPPWDHGYVAEEDGSPVGFIAMRFESWNRRLVITHLYVDSSQRRRGIARLLIERAIDWGRDRGALIGWVETSNRNFPGVQIYRRLGFEICGFDVTHYRGTPHKEEFALFLARPITPRSTDPPGR